MHHGPQICVSAVLIMRFGHLLFHLNIGHPVVSAVLIMTSGGPSGGILPTGDRRTSHGVWKGNITRNPIVIHENDILGSLEREYYTDTAPGLRPTVGSV